MTHSRRRRIAESLGALCAAFLIASCGGGSGGNPTAPSGPPTPRLLQQGEFALPAPTDDSVFFALTSVTDPAPGRWEASVDWAISTNTLWMWVADGVCTVEQFAKPVCPFETTCECRFTIRSEVATPKPRVLTIPSAPGGTRTLIVANVGPREEEVEYRVTLTSSNTVSGDSSLVSDAKAGSPSRVLTGRKRAPRPQ